MDNASNSFFIILLLVIFLIVQSCKKLKWFVDNTSFSFFSLLIHGGEAATQLPRMAVLLLRLQCFQ